MTVSLDEMLATLDPERREIEGRAAELIAEEMTLRELRKARKLTQASVARTPHQPGRRLTAGAAQRRVVVHVA